MQHVSTFSSWDAARRLSAPWQARTDVGRIRRLAAGDTLYSQGDTHDRFYLVRTGLLHTTVLRPSGQALLLEIFGPGAIFGEASAFIDTQRYVTAVAVTPAVLSEYRAADIAAMVAAEPQLAISLIQLLGIKHRILIGKLLSLTAASPQARLIGLLGRLALTAEDPSQVRLTHEQLASMAALTRVTVTRALKVLAEEGLISTRSKGVEILDAPALIARLGHI